MKKVLLVGDLRTAGNYGAVATTEALMDLILRHDDIELKAIDHRSMRSETPAEGWEKSVQEEMDRSSVQNKPLRDYIIYKLIEKNLYQAYKVMKNRKNHKKPDNIPARYDMYPDAVRKVLDSQMWKYEKGMMDWADIVIINAEGNIVNGTDENGCYRPGGRYVLFFAYVVKSIMNKPCYIINHTVDPQNRDVRNIIVNVYPMMDGVYVREKYSLDTLHKWGIENVKYVPDALWTHNFANDIQVKAPECLSDFDFSQPYICLGDSSGLSNGYGRVKWDVLKVYTQLIRGLQTICPQIIFIDGFSGKNIEIRAVIAKNNLKYVNINNCNYHELYYLLAHAKACVSGRWHASIIALLAHTPVICWGADSYKTEALYGEVNYPYKFFDISAIPLNIDQIVSETKKALAAPNAEVWKQVDMLRKQAGANADML